MAAADLLASAFGFKRSQNQHEEQKKKEERIKWKESKILIEALLVGEREGRIGTTTARGQGDGR